MKLHHICILAAIGVLLLNTPSRAEPLQTKLLSALETPAAMSAGSYNASDASVAAAQGVAAKVGSGALSLGLAANGPGGKGDYDFKGVSPGSPKSLSCWVYLPEEHSIQKLGLQVYDAKGETLFHLQEAGWKGWRRIRVPITDSSFKQAYPQDKHNGRIDLPLKGVHFVYFVSKAGPTHLSVDGLEGEYEVQDAGAATPLEVRLCGATDIGLGKEPTATLVLTNGRNTTARVNVLAVLQADPYLSDLDFRDGTASGSTAIPVTGEKIAEVSRAVQVPALGYKVVTLPFEKPAVTGSYSIVAKIVDGDQVTLSGQRLFCEPAPIEVAASSKFGLNAARWSLAKEHVKLGIGWVRFENFKWPMVSGKADHYSFSPGPAPWGLDIDDAIKTYTDAGLNVLPMMFLTPDWAADDVPGLNKNVKLARVPRDPRKFGQFAFQTAARFGSRKVDADKLLSDDKLSGKNQIKYFELGNEPNLNPLRGGRLPTWGPWVGTMNQFWEIYKAGATAVKEADPDAQVASPGFAGMTCETVDAMRTHTYADGTHPIDYCDMLSVHFYSGRTPPEIATRDANNAADLDVPFDEHVRRTVEWRDRYRPGIPIWLTETGYDTGGPIGTNERTQSARLPRVVMIALHNGFDKVLVYRESGSTPTQHAASGVLRNDLTRRPSWYTYATLIRQLDEATPDAQIRLAAENAWAYTWNRDGRLQLTAWTVTGTGKFGLELGRATVTDAFGNSRTVDSTADLKLTEFPLYIGDFGDNDKLDALREQARAGRAARRARREELARLKAYLFDFGDNKEPQSTNLGRMRYFTKVPAARVYSGESGFGFEEKPGEKDEYAHWRRNPIERHAVNTYATSFRCDVEAGTYRMRLKVTGPAGKAIVIDTGSRRQTVKAEEDKPVDLTVDADRGYLRIINPGRLAYQYLTLIEVK